MSTGILSTRPVDRRLRRGGRVVQRSREGEEEKPAHAGDEAKDAQDQADDCQRAASQRPAAGRDPLPGDESHDGGRRAEDHAKAQEEADQRDDADDQRGDGETVGALGRVAGPRLPKSARRRWHVAAPTGRRWRGVASPGRWRRWRWAVTSARRRRWRWRRFAAPAWRRWRGWRRWQIRHRLSPYVVAVRSGAVAPSSKL